MQKWLSDWGVFGIRIVAHFDGIYYFLNQDRSFEMRQPFLIKKIVYSIEMSDDANPNDTPEGKPQKPTSIESKTIMKLTQRRRNA